VEAGSSHRYAHLGDLVHEGGLPVTYDGWSSTPVVLRSRLAS